METSNMLMTTTASNADSRISTRRKLFLNPYGPELGDVPQQKNGSRRNGKKL